MEKEQKNLHNIRGQQGIKRLQKQKQIASGQPHKGCDAPGENKKQKQNQKQQSTSSIAAVCRKKKTTTKQLLKQAEFSSGMMLMSCFFNCIYCTSTWYSTR